MQTEIEELFEAKPSAYKIEHQQIFYRFKTALNEGKIRAAEPAANSPTGWRVNAWVKKGILQM